MYFFAIALTCIAFAAYVLFVMLYKTSAKPVAAKQPQHKPPKRKPVNTNNNTNKKPSTTAAQQPAKKPKATTTSSKANEQSATTTKPSATKDEAKQPTAKPKAKAQPQQAKKPKRATPLPQKKTPSAENLSDFEKLEGEEEIFEDGWEIIQRRKPKKDSPADDNDTSASETEAIVEKPKTEKKSPREKRLKKEQREKGEGARNNNNNNREKFEGGAERKNRKGGDKLKFTPRFEQGQATAQPEKKKPQPARDVRVGNYIFSRALPSARAGQETPFDALSRFVEDKATHSDDTSPLKTAHLELRYYKEAPKPQKAKPGVVWEAMAKYNYTNKPPQSEEEKEEGEGEEESGTSEEMPFAKEEELVDCFLRALGAVYTKHLNKPHLEKGKPQRFLSQTDLETTKQDLLKLLMQGVSEEPPVCHNKEEASEFVEKVFGQFDHSSLRCFSHMGSRLWTRGFGDEGFFLFDNSKIALFWFLGYD